MGEAPRSLEYLREQLERFDGSSPRWREVVWAAALAVAQGHHDAVDATLERSFLDGDGAPQRPPCPCGVWSRWLSHLPAEEEERSVWFRMLAQVEMARRAELGWLGCPVRAWLEEDEGGGLRPRPALGLRCRQRLVAADGIVQVRAADPQSAPSVLVEVDAEGRLYARAEGAALEVNGVAAVETAALPPGAVLGVEGTRWRVGEGPTDVVCIHGGGTLPAQRLRLAGDEALIYPWGDARLLSAGLHTNRRFLATRQPKGWALTDPSWPGSGAVYVGVLDRAEAAWDVAVVAHASLHVERWPHAPAAPAHPPRSASDVLEHLRGVLVSPMDHTTFQRVVREAVTASIAVEDGDLALDYLAHHLHGRAEPWTRPPCPCGRWGRCLRTCPPDPASRDAWLGRWAPDASAEPGRVRWEPLRLAERERRCAVQTWLVHPRWSPMQDWLALPLACLQGLAAAPSPPGALHTTPADHPDARWRAAVERDALTLEPLRPGGAPQRVLDGATVLLDGEPWRFYADCPPGTLDISILSTAHRARIRLDRPRVTLGRANATLTLNHPDVSRLHASIEYRDGAFLLRDEQSASGTQLNSRFIHHDARLHDGDVIRLGLVELKIHLE